MISDWLGIDRITSPAGANYTYSVQAGINAGIDMVCFFENTLAYYYFASYRKYVYLFVVKKVYGSRRRSVHNIPLYF